MKTIILAIVFIAVGFGAAYFIFSDTDSHTSATMSESGKVQQYTCGMHPEIVTNEPGYCPICEMKLTPKKTDNSKTGMIKIDATTTQNMGLKTTLASYHSITRMVRASGKVDYSEPSIYSINLKTKGWVEKLYVNYEGAEIKTGQPLLEIYSPELVAAQREYLIALKVSEYNKMSNLIQSSKERLKNWDISEDQIKALETNNEITRTMTIRANTDGIVIKKSVDEGDYLKPGMELFKIADLSEVWIVTNVYEQDLPFISLGQTGEISIPSLGNRLLSGKVAYISNFLDNNGQVEVRINVDNTDFKLKPNMYAEVAILSELSEKKLSIPRSAIINSGTKQVVYISSEEGVFEPRVIKTGVVGSNDIVEVKNGLNENEKVVTSGQFLLDSESRLNEALSDGVMIGHDHGSMASNDVKSEKETEKHDGHDMNMESSPDKMDTKSGIFTCPMPSHYHVLQYGPGKCKECKMDLVPVEDTKIDSVYVCPMEEDKVVSDKPGRCEKCNMKLELRRIEHKEKMESSMDSKMTEDKQEHDKMKMPSEEFSFGPDERVAIGGHDIYTCPMPSHYHVLQYGEGKCAECGMNLVKLEETKNKKVYVCPMTECESVQDHKGKCKVCGMDLVGYKPEKNDDK